MILVVTEKNNAATKIAQLLADTKPKADKVYDTQIYRFNHKGEEWVTIGLRGHILSLDFANRLEYKKSKGWYGVDGDGNEVPAPKVPDHLDKPPFKKKSPFDDTGLALNTWKIPALPYLVYAPVLKYPQEKGIIRSLKSLAKKADSIIIATDFDREGELIGADAVSMIRQVSEAPISRARYSALTKGEITHAFDNLVELDINLANAGDSRRIIDLVWGAALTRYLTTVKRGGFSNTRSAGRVQTPTLAILVEREKERQAFVPKDYWVIKAKCKNDAGESFAVNHKKDRFDNQQDAEAAYNNVKDATSAKVVQIDKRVRKVPPPTPFSTTALQTTASSIGLTPARVMRIAESLYMDGYISYPRVDNTVYPKSINLAENVKMLAQNPIYEPYARKLLASPIKATRGKTETTDHPPIHPVRCASSDVLSAEEWKLYNLITRRFLATLSDPAQIEATKITLDVNGEEFVGKGDAVLDPGFREIYPYGAKKEDELPVVKDGEVLAFLDPELIKKQTEPPSRYSQGRLIQEMERLGLGTKSTRHSTIERLQQVKYIQNNPLEPTQLGIAVIDALGEFAPRIVSPTMTSELEDEMSQISVGEQTLDTVVDHSRDLLDDVIEVLMPKAEEVGETLADAVQADAKVGSCPKCGHDLLVKNSLKTKSRFIGCAGWPDCDVTYPLPPKGNLLPTENKCPSCGGSMVRVQAFRSKPYEMCIDPNCVSNQEPKVDVGLCKTCEEMGKVSHLIAQKNPKTLNRFIRCTNYEECNTSYPLPREGAIEATGERCESCGAPLVVLQRARGPWKLCPNMNCEKNQKDTSAKGARAKGKGKTGAKTKTKSTSTKRAGAKSKAGAKAGTAKSKAVDA